MHPLTNIIRLLRPHQWVKNLFVFLPIFFNGRIQDGHALAASCIAFVCFSLAASSIYCLNDILDAEADRRHPVKRLRPVASGAISRQTAYAVMAACMGLSLAIPFLPIVGTIIGGGKFSLCLVIAAYILTNIAYCLRLKQIAIVDVFIIAAGFVMRILAGGFSADIYLSQWIVLMTFLLALFLAFAKRRDDVAIYEKSGVMARKNVARYSLAFINQAISIVASITVVCYIMYTVSPDVTERLHSHYVYLTSFFVLAGIIRYLQITIVDVKSGSPTKVLMGDRFIQACVAAWMLTFALIIYVF